MNPRFVALGAISSAMAATLLLSACGSGGGEPSPPPAPQAQINAANMVDSYAIGAAAFEQGLLIQGLWQLAAVSVQLDPQPGSHACPGGGSYQYSVAGQTATLSFSNCSTAQFQFAAGSISYTSGLQGANDWDVTVQDLQLAPATDPAATRVVKGTLQHRFGSDAVHYVNSGSFELQRKGRTDKLSLQASYLLQNMAAVPESTQLSLQTARFAQALQVQASGAALNAVTVSSAGDGSSVTGIAQALGSLRLDLRSKPSDAPLSSQQLSQAELEAAMKRVD